MTDRVEQLGPWRPWRMPETQHCPRCDQDLSQDAYHPDKWRKPGHYCRACMIEYKREWRRARGIGPRRVKAPRTPKPHTHSTTYRAVHKRVQRAKGHASNHPCAHCTSTAEEWAYDHTDPAPLVGTTGRGISAEYSTDLARYLPLCKPCHSRFDARRTNTIVDPTPRPRTAW